MMIIGLMLGPVGILGEAVFWNAVLTYGAVGTTAWGGVHIKQCGI
jgi:hypothetical protein